MNRTTIHIGEDYVIKSPVDSEEIDILLKLQHHPFIIHVIGMTEKEIMFERADMDGYEFAFSHDLTNRKRIILQLVMGMEYIHSMGIIHCDI